MVWLYFLVVGNLDETFSEAEVKQHLPNHTKNFTLSQAMLLQGNVYHYYHTSPFQ